jgi:hypothetical protein
VWVELSGSSNSTVYCLDTSLGVVEAEVL